jgi:prefoldin subunit 5
MKAVTDIRVFFPEFYLFQEVHVFLDTTRTLKMAQTKFQDSNDCLEKITPDSEGKTIMVPLTGSVSFDDSFK